MYCRADVHFMVFFLLALRDAFTKVQMIKGSSGHSKGKVIPITGLCGLEGG